MINIVVMAIVDCSMIFEIHILDLVLSSIEGGNDDDESKSLSRRTHAGAWSDARQTTVPTIFSLASTRPALLCDPHTALVCWVPSSI